MRVHVTLKTGNRKLVKGKQEMSTLTTERASCPDNCPFKREWDSEAGKWINKGCYMDQYPGIFHWDKVSKGERGGDWPEFIKKIPQMSDIYRGLQAGDCPHKNGVVDRPKMLAWADANLKHDKRAWLYSHHEASKENLDTFRMCVDKGLIVNLSANSLNHADRLAESGLPVVVTVPHDYEKKLYFTSQGRRVVMCPAQYKDVSCADCLLCLRYPRNDVIIGFQAHGVHKARIKDIFNSYEEKYR